MKMGPEIGLYSILFEKFIKVLAKSYPSLKIIEFWGRKYLKIRGDDDIWIQIILVLVFILSRYWFKSIIRSPPPQDFALNLILFSFSANFATAGSPPAVPTAAKQQAPSCFATAGTPAAASPQPSFGKTLFLVLKIRPYCGKSSNSQGPQQLEA